MPTVLEPDVVIFGGGAAGLWLLDHLLDAGYQTLLLEAHTLGSGQTVASQGIIHGGLKYTLKGLFTGSADAIKQMPLTWRDALSGQHKPNLTATRLRAPFVHLWHTQSVTSRVGMLGAKSLLRVKPQTLPPDQWPEALAGCTGQIYKLDEQVIDPASFIATLAQQHGPHILKIDAQNGIAFDLAAPGQIQTINLNNPDPNTADTIVLQPTHVIFTAGQGNATLRQMAGLSDQVMQRRPLHMIVAKGLLPTLNGHCIDGNKTSVTITTDQDPQNYAQKNAQENAQNNAQNNAVWQIGGQVAEDGVAMEPLQLIKHTKNQLKAALGPIDLEQLHWTTYRVDRAEAVTTNNVRPDDAQTLHEGNVITGWPTKLALAPALAHRIAKMLDPPRTHHTIAPTPLEHWPRPQVAAPPWETAQQWFENV